MIVFLLLFDGGFAYPPELEWVGCPMCHVHWPTTLKKDFPVRIKPVLGKGDDHRKYYRCWNCGFVCNVTRDKLYAKRPG
jgi:hypothetical protein